MVRQALNPMRVQAAEIGGDVKVLVALGQCRNAAGGLEGWKLGRVAAVRSTARGPIARPAEGESVRNIQKCRGKDVFGKLCCGGTYPVTWERWESISHPVVHAKDLANQGSSAYLDREADRLSRGEGPPP